MAQFKEMYLNARVLRMLPLGFASGLPLALTGDTLAARARESGVSLTDIGMLSLVSLPYTLKFLWAALLDRYAAPILDRRRSWMLICQLLLIAGIVVLGRMDPKASPLILGVAALLVAFFSASQDIALDAYRTDVLDENQRGSGTAFFVGGYRIGMILSGGLALVLAGHGMSWTMVYAAMGLAMLLGVNATLFAEPASADIPRPATLNEAVVAPLMQIISRRGGLLVICFIILFKLPDVAAAGLTTPFLLDIGVSKSDIGYIRQTYGLAVTIVGALAGGGIVGVIGLRKSLWIFGILQALSNAGFLLLAWTQRDRVLLTGVISVESFCGGLVTAGFTAFLMSQCDRRYSAFQFALLSSAMAVTRVLTGPASGPIAEHLGWSAFFILTIVAAVPGIALLPLVPLEREALLDREPAEPPAPALEGR